MDDIQLAQVTAAEDAVVQRLRKKGLLPPDNPAGDAHCNDCLRQYGDEHGFPDLTIPDAIWERISPRKDEGGLLCPSCICKRLHAAGIRCEGKFASGPIVSSNQRQQLESALVTTYKSEPFIDVTRGGFWCRCSLGFTLESDLIAHLTAHGENPRENLRQSLQAALATAFVSMQATYNPGERQGLWLECVRLGNELRKLTGESDG